MSATQIKRKARKEAKKIINSKLLHSDSSVEVQFQDQGVAVVNNIDIVNEARGESRFEDFLDSGSDSVASDENYENDVTYDLRSELSKWASDFGISFVAFNALLCVLNKCNIKVPKDARTVLQTPAEVVKRNVGDGIYVHYGLKNALTDFLVLNDFRLPNIMLDFGIDGLPLFKTATVGNVFFVEGHGSQARKNV
uniref:Uncharacterized protein n=1 Tax=Bactrocera dorsalis TaxID=27457 RepID=A0A034UZB8_BACDO